MKRILLIGALGVMPIASAEKAVEHTDGDYSSPCRQRRGKRAAHMRFGFNDVRQAALPEKSGYSGMRQCAMKSRGEQAMILCC